MTTTAPASKTINDLATIHDTLFRKLGKLNQEEMLNVFANDTTLTAEARLIATNAVQQGFTGQVFGKSYQFTYGVCASIEVAIMRAKKHTVAAV